MKFKIGTHRCYGNNSFVGVYHRLPAMGTTDFQGSAEVAQRKQAGVSNEHLQCSRSAFLSPSFCLLPPLLLYILENTGASPRQAAGQESG